MPDLLNTELYFRYILFCKVIGCYFCMYMDIKVISHLLCFYLFLLIILMFPKTIPDFFICSPSSRSRPFAKTWKNPLILAKSSFSPNVDHCSKPRGYPRKIFYDVLTNMYTTTKKIIKIFGGGSVTSKKNHFRTPWFGTIQEGCQKIDRPQTHEPHPRFFRQPTHPPKPPLQPRQVQNSSCDHRMSRQTHNRYTINP